MSTTYNPITLADLTEAITAGSGVFDVLMKANKAHLEQEFLQGRIKGNEYATVYLGSLQSVLQAALTFTLEREKQNLEAQLQVKRIEIAAAELLKTQAEVQLVNAQTAGTNAEKVLTDKKSELTMQQALNAIVENDVLVAQKCKLQAEFDVLQNTNLKTAQETNLLAQKVATERAQTQSLGVDADSVVGKQKQLYQAQTAGFARDAEQKAADLMIKTWNVRRTTNEDTPANTTNKLDDTSIGKAVDKLLIGVGAV
jgi:hypothetical protein